MATVTKSHGPHLPPPGGICLLCSGSHPLSPSPGTGAAAPGSACFGLTWGFSPEVTSTLAMGTLPPLLSFSGMEETILMNTVQWEVAGKEKGGGVYSWKQSCKLGRSD